MKWLRCHVRPRNDFWRVGIQAIGHRGIKGCYAHRCLLHRLSTGAIPWALTRLNVAPNADQSNLLASLVWAGLKHNAAVHQWEDAGCSQG
jgi:hypothetical protein